MSNKKVRPQWETHRKSVSLIVAKHFNIQQRIQKREKHLLPRLVSPLDKNLLKCLAHSLYHLFINNSSLISKKKCKKTICKNYEVFQNQTVCRKPPNPTMYNKIIFVGDGVLDVPQKWREISKSNGLNRRSDGY